MRTLVPVNVKFLIMKKLGQDASRKNSRWSTKWTGKLLLEPITCLSRLFKFWCKWNNMDTIRMNSSGGHLFNWILVDGRKLCIRRYSTMRCRVMRACHLAMLGIQALQDLWILENYSEPRIERERPYTRLRMLSHTTSDKFFILVWQGERTSTEGRNSIGLFSH
jgi:hypothetical protein